MLHTIVAQLVLVAAVLGSPAPAPANLVAVVRRGPPGPPGPGPAAGPPPPGAGPADGTVNAKGAPGSPGHEFAAPTPQDQRSPCPFLNTLSNHAYLPRNGQNVSEDQMSDAFSNVFNVDPSVTRPIVEKVLASGKSTGNVAQKTINLKDLQIHNLIEHDGSLSRNDAALGDSTAFDPAVWNQFKAFFTGPTISIEQVAKARVARVGKAEAANPKIDFSQGVAKTSLTETAFIMQIFANGGVDGGANTAQLNMIFEQERLQDGFPKPAGVMTADTLKTISMKITAVASVPQDGAGAGAAPGNGTAPGGGNPGKGGKGAEGAEGAQAMM